MRGWIVPPPKAPSKTKAEFHSERRARVRALEAQGLLRSAAVSTALLKVEREEFISRGYRDYAYEDSGAAVGSWHRREHC